MMRSDLYIMPRSHLHVKPSRKAVRRFSRNGIGRGYLVAVTGSTWQLRGLCGCYMSYMYVASFRYAPREAANSHVDPVIAT